MFASGVIACTPDAACGGAGHGVVSAAGIVQRRCGGQPLRAGARSQYDPVGAIP